MRDVWDSTPLYCSCLCVCRYLTEHKEVELNMRDVWDSTPLFYSCLCVCRYLTEHKEVELNMRDVWDFAPPLLLLSLCV